ncbi:hypothetical protein RRG08_004180 [Elysia crispata]|uniref:Ankyrin repeat protein n=1 Tax=Elysia crispata TaxID=231223 RepID=A0AAE0YWG8_9GAST|nr:hypothetical protein RRG08_004180 [Elysia crispata]
MDDSAQMDAVDFLKCAAEKAVKERGLETLENLLTTVSHENLRKSLAFQLLKKAISSGNECAVRTLLSFDIDGVMLMATGGPVTLALDRGDPGLLRILLDQGAAPLVKQGESEYGHLLYAVHKACYYNLYHFHARASVRFKEEFENRKSCIQMLLEAGADVNYMTQKRDPALMVAMQSVENARDLAPLLVSYGADVNFQAGSSYGLTPLMLAVIHCDPGFENEDVLAYLVGSGANVNAKCSVGNTALHLAAGRRKFKPALWLIENGADIYAQNKRSRSFIDELRYEDFVELLPKLVYNGFYPNNMKVDIMDQFVVSSSRYNYLLPATPLSVAVWLGEVKIVNLLIETGFLTAADVRRWSGLMQFVNGVEACDSTVIDPCPLLLVSFVKVSDMLGASPDRTTRVKQLGLPVALQERLLFKRPQTKFRVFEAYHR